MTVPSSDELDLVTCNHCISCRDILEDFIDCMAKVNLAICKRRPIVNHIGFSGRVLIDVGICKLGVLLNGQLNFGIVLAGELRPWYEDCP